MPTFNVKAPDGSIIPVNAPDGATEQQAIEFAAKTWKPTAQKPADEPPPTYGVAINAANKGLAAVPDAILNTPTNLLNLGKMAYGAGVTALGRPDMAPEVSEPPNYVNRLLKAGGFIQDRLNPQTTGQRVLDTLVQGASAGMVAPASSLSRVATNAALGAISTGAGEAVGEATGSPELGISASIAAPAGIAPVSRLAARGASTAAKNVLGLTTGVGPENIGTAAKAGAEGKTAYWDNLTGNVPKDQILDQARQALENMRLTRGTNYRSGIATTAANQTPLSFSDIDTALNNVTQSMKSGGHWKIGQPEANKIQEVADIVDEWRQDPSMHTAMGLDALKQRLDAVYPDSPAQNQAQRAITTVRNAVKDTIVKQSPEYADTMKAYEEALGLENEIKRTLSIGNKSAADTTLRKLQSLARNNVNSSYGYRLDLAKALQDQGGVDLLPAISGQAMNSWIPRGLAGQAEGMATIGGAMLHNPLLAALLPFQSPKVVGAAAYGSGKAFGPISNRLAQVSMTPEQSNLANALLYQSQRDGR